MNINFPKTDPKCPTCNGTFRVAPDFIQRYYSIFINKECSPEPVVCKSCYDKYEEESFEFNKQWLWNNTLNK